VTNNKKLLF